MAEDTAPAGLADFAGLWRIRRRIEDRRAGREARLDGLAEFRSGGEGLVCEERGRLSYGAGAPVEARQTHLWRAAGPRRIEVLFGDGRPFHQFTLGPAAAAAHWCAPDSYRVSYDFSGWPEWRSVWEVRGPRKDYRSETLYSCAAP